MHEILCAKMKRSLIISVFIGIAGMLCASTVTYDTINNVPCRVYLPTSYETSESEYPVLYLQHGMWGDESDWVRLGHLDQIMDSLLRAGVVREMVIIMPDNCPHRPTSLEEKNNAMSGEWEAQFRTFMDESEAKYRISHSPKLRAIAGLSMGGYHTMRVSTMYDGQFEYIGMFSAATFVHEAASSPTLLWLSIGKDDFLYSSFHCYRDWLDANHREYMYYETEGGHEWPNWQDYIVRFLKKIFRN